MAPLKPEHPLGWSTIAKWAIGIIGAMLSIAIGLAASAAERQTKALEQLKEAVYTGQKDNAVIQNRVSTVEKDLGETKDRVRVLESKLIKEK